MLLSENEQLKKLVDDHEEYKKLKTKQMDMLCVVFESRMGISVEVEFDKIKIRRAEARRIERERLAAKAAATASKDTGKDKVHDIPKIVLVDEPVTVPYSEEENQRLAEVECRRNKYKKDDEDDDEDEEDDEFKYLDDHANHSKDDNDNDDDDDDHGGGNAFQIMSRSGDNHLIDYLNDNQNDEREDDHSKGESGSGAQHDEESSRIFTEVTPLTAAPYTREEIMEMMGINDESFTFDFEKELDEINPDEPENYVFKDIPNANDLDDVVVEDDSDDEPFRYTGEGSEDFPTFKELFSVHNEEMLRRKVEEREFVKKVNPQRLVKKICVKSGKSGSGRCQRN
ncbi:hypothetical protein Hanom_Chr08g00725441 [Helianthus anomalus]